MRHSRTSYVYFVQCPANGFVKIGVTGDHPDVRLSQLRKGSPVPLHPLGFIRGSVTVEHALHVRFRASRSHGEWFRWSDDLRCFIEQFVRPWPPAPTAPIDRLTDRWEEWLDREMRRLGRDALAMQQIENRVVKPNPLKGLVAHHEVARLCGVSTSCLKGWVERGLFPSPHSIIEQRRFYRLEDINHYLDKGKWPETAKNASILPLPSTWVGSA